MKTVEIDNDHIIKSISELKLDEHDKEEEERKTLYYINALKKEQEKFKDNDKAKYDQYENEINDKKNDLEHKNRIHNESKPAINDKTKERINKLYHLIDIMESLCAEFKIEPTYEPVETRFDTIFNKTIPPTIIWKDDFILNYDSEKNHKQFLDDRESKGDNRKAWEMFLQDQVTKLKKKKFTLIKITRKDYDPAIYIKDKGMIYSNFLFPLFNSKDQEDDRFKHCITNIFSQCYNQLYYLNTLTYSWKIDIEYKFAILYIEFKNEPK